MKRSMRRPMLRPRKVPLERRLVITAGPPPSQHAPRPPRLRSLLARYAWWPLPVCLLAGLLGGGAHALLAERRYEASGQVLVSGPDREAAIGYAQAYGRLATDGAVLTAAHADAGVPVAWLRERVRAASSPDAPLIEVTGTAASGTDAARAANAVARAVAVYANDTVARTGATLSLVTPASPNATPVSPSPLVSLATGACTGAVLGSLALLTRGPRPARPASAARPARALPAAGGGSPPVVSKQLSVAKGSGVPARAG
jgi:capsular polysaccharide biosynthesis protein